MSSSSKASAAGKEIIPSDRSIRFTRHDFSELVERITGEFGPHSALVYAYDSGDRLNLSYSQVKEHIETVMKEMTDRGFTAGDRVAIVAPLSPFYLMTLFSMPCIGITVALIDDSLPSDEIRRLLKISDPSALITIRDRLENFDESFRNSMPCFVFGEDKRVLTHVEGTPENIVSHTVDPDEDVMMVLFSSGTTGLMKGVNVTYHSVMRAMEVDSKIVGLDGVPGKINYFYVLPLNHIAGYISAMVAFFWGAELDFLENVTPLRYLDGLKMFQPTHFLTVPAVFDIMEQKAFEKIREKGKLVHFAIKSILNFNGFVRRKTGIKMGRKLFKGIYSQFLGENIVTIVTGASPVKDSTPRFFIGMGLEWVNFYATTETNIPIAAISAADNIKYESSGKYDAVDVVKIRVADVDEEGIGEIQVNTELIMKGYFRDPVSTEKAFDGEWFHTGDRGYIDRRGRVRIVGRIKESIILRNGKKVASQDVDAYYAELIGGAYQVACCGVPTEEGYDEIHMFVLDESFSNERKDEIKSELRSSSAAAASMYSLDKIHFIEEIPKTSVGKIRRFVLRDIALYGKKPSPESNKTIQQDMDDLFSVLRKYRPDVRITEDSKLIDDLGLDSITLFNVKCDLEQIYDRDLGYLFARAVTVKDLLETLENDDEVVVENVQEQDMSMYPSPRNEETGKRLRKWARRLSMPYKFEVKGLENIPTDGDNYIISSNHESYLDPFWIVNAGYGRMDYSRIAGMAAKERFDDRGIESRLADVFGAIPVDRFGDALPATKRALECLQNEKYIMMIFPEGARSRDGTMLPFKEGAAELSIQSGKRILPVRIDGSFEIFPRHKKYPKFIGLKRRKLTIVFGETMDPKDYESATEMTEELKNRISRL